MGATVGVTFFWGGRCPIPQVTIAKKKG